MTERTPDPPALPSLGAEALQCDINGTPLTQLLVVAVTVLQQAADLVENVLTSDEQLTVHSKYLPGSTIGALSSETRIKPVAEYPRQH
jgi:hypothetical protein